MNLVLMPEWTISLCLSREMQMMVKVEMKLKRMGRTPVIVHNTRLTTPGNVNIIQPTGMVLTDCNLEILLLT